MATYYVSSEATNGYAVGDDANDGLSKGAPFLTLDPFEAGGFSWDDADVIYLNGAEINCSAGLTLDGTCTIQGDVDKTQINLRSETASNYGILFTDGKTHTFSHCVVHYGGCTTAPFNPTTAVSLCTAVFDDVEIVYRAWGIYSATAALLLDLTMTDCKFTSTYTAAAANSPLYCVTFGAASAVTLTRVQLALAHATITSVRGGIILGASVAGLVCTVDGLNGSITRSSGTSVYYGLSIADFATVEVKNCNLSFSGTGAAHAIRVNSEVQTVTAASIHDNTIRITNPDGIGICGGEDGGDNVMDGILIYGNVVDGRGRTAGGALHGIEVGGNEASHIYNNVVYGTVYGFVSKETTASLISNNVVFDVSTMAYYAKGADASVWIGNGQICTSTADNGTTLQIDDNDENHSTGVICAGNWRYDYAGVTSATYFVVVAADNEATFYGNNWYRVDGITGNRWYHVDGAKSWAQWNALANVVGDTNFQFSPRHRTRKNHRLLTLTRGV